MEAVHETKQAKQNSYQPLALLLALAFDHCPSVLFAFLSDNEAARVARALCMPQFLSTKRYDIKRELPVHAAVAGLFPGMVRRVVLDQYEESGSLSLLPPTVTSVKVEHDSQWDGRLVELPRSLTHLKYCADDDIGVTTPEDWPASLTSLEFQYRKSKPLSTPLPSALRVLHCNTDLSPSLILPDSLTTLRAFRLARPVSQLPPHLTKLSMRLPYAVTSEDLADFPASLTHLTVYRVAPIDEDEDKEVCQPITLKPPPLLRVLCLKLVPLAILDTLPESLEELTIIGDMPALDRSLHHARLRKLVLPGDFNQPIRASDFPSLQVLSVGTKFNHPLSLSGSTVCDRPQDRLPSSLRSLVLRSPLLHDLDHLPDSLTELSLLGSHFNKPLDHLPRQLKMLILDQAFQQPLDALPDGLTCLNLAWSRTFNQPLDHLPDSLQELRLPKSFNRPFQRLPSALQVLRFPCNSCFNHPLDHLPNSLSDLRLGDAFNQPFRRLPRGLTRLSLGRAFSHPLPLSPDADNKDSFHSDVTYPTALRSLILDSFNHPLSLPPSLTELTLSPKSPVPLSIASLPEQLTVLQLPLKNYPQLADLESLRKRCPLLRLRDKRW